MRTLNNINDVWVYDNPDTGCRELYKHGHLLTFYPANAFIPLEPGDPGYDQDSHYNGYKGTWQDAAADRWVQEMYIQDTYSLGDWSEGKEWGNRIHKPFDPLATQIYVGD